MIKNILIGGLGLVLVIVVWMNIQTKVEVTPESTITETDKGVNYEQKTDSVPPASDTSAKIVPKGGGIALDMSNKGLATVSQDVFKQTAVISLNLSNNKLSGSLPAEVRLLSKLTVLNLSSNNFTGVPAEIGQLTELRVLDLSNNPITGLPYELGNLQKLEKLDVSGTNYSKADLKIIREKLPTTTIIVTD